METREEINLKMTILELLMLMSEGNPGALSVLSKLIDDEIGFILIFALDDMNIRGTQIWIGYKDFCKENLEDFIKAIKDRNKEMIDYINKIGLEGNHEYKAVISGASKQKREKLTKG